MKPKRTTKIKSERFGACFFAALLLASMAIASAANAATFTVDSTADAVDANPGNGVCATATGVCTLRSAIQEANALAGDDTIVLPAGTYTLARGSGDDSATNGDLDITGNLTLQGSGARNTIVSGGTGANLDRVFDIRNNSTVWMSGITVSNGVTSGADGGGFNVDSGCSLTLTDLVVSNNQGKNGGGIINNGTLMLLGVTISGNSATSGTGGGIQSGGGSPINYLTNVTISGNSATGDGGGADLDNGVLVNATITANSTSASGSGLNKRGSQTFTLLNTIIAGNTGVAQCAGTPTSLGYNLASDASCNLTATGDLPNANPLLGGLGDNGGPTHTHALLSGSPAIEAGTNTGAPATDQRGFTRPSDGDQDGTATTDIGAYEVQEPIGIDCVFGDWTSHRPQFMLDDEGGRDDFNGRLDITRYGVSSNLTDEFYILIGFDDLSFTAAQETSAAVLIDTDLDDNINYLFTASVLNNVWTVELWSCDNTEPYGCNNSVLQKTYLPGDYCVGTGAGPWDTDTFVEAKLPYSDLGSFTGGDKILTALVSYNKGWWRNPKDSIFGSTGQDYDDRVQYDTDNGNGQKIPEAGTPLFTGVVYADEEIAPIGVGKTVQLMINGAIAGSDTTSVNGDYLIVAPANAGDTILVYIDGDLSYQGNTVTVMGNSSPTGLDIYAGHVITRQDNGGALTNANLAAAKGGSSDSDILYSAAGALTVNGTGTELYIPTGHRFSPGGAITTPHMKSLGTFNGGSGTMDINGTLAINGGTFTATSGTMSISGNFDHSGGTFTHNSGTVTLDGTGQSILGSTAFFNLTKSVTSADTLTFQAGSTQTFSGTVALQGASGNLLRLPSSSPGTQWNFTVNAGATKAISYVDVQDSNASGSDATKKPIYPSNSVDSGNNLDWFSSSTVNVSISSAANQEFIVGDPATAISQITVTDHPYTPEITAANDIRIRIPDNLYMTWDTSDTTASIGGGAAAKVSTTVSYEDGGKTLVINVTSNFAANESITVSGLSFTNFTQAAYSENLELEVENDGSAIALDDKWIAIGGLPAAGSMLVYGEGTVITPRYRSWNGTAFSLEGSAPNTDDRISWVVLKASPVANEMLLGVYASATKTLFVLTWNGSSWISNWSVNMNLNESYRGFDIAYERNSGDAVVVFSDQATHTLRYRKRVSGAWDASDQTIATLDDEADWVRAESRPTNDDIFVAAESNAKSVYAMRWNGTSNTWGDQVLASSKVKDQAREAIEIAFERASGNAFLIWGDDARNLKYRIFTTSWQAEATAYAGLPSEACLLTADYDSRSTSSSIAVGMVLDNTTFEFGAWNGTSWVARPAAIAAKNKDQRGIEVQFNSSSGQAMYIFNQNANPRQLAWRTWSAAAGFGAVTVEAGNTPADINYMQLKANPGGDEMMAVYVDNNKDLVHRYWDGSSWTALATTLEADISDQDKNEAFMFAWRASPPTAIDLLSLTARGESGYVLVSWTTAQEVDNFGFHVYRATSKVGPYTRITDKLIPGLSFSVRGRAYSYVDRNVTQGRLYYYKLEDIDMDGTRTMHGPVCVDWDRDGIADDWEIKYGLNTSADDSGLDPDGDGLTNLQESNRNTDPFRADTDGDGVPDSEEALRSGSVTQGLMRGVEVIASDANGMTLELRTESFESVVLEEGGVSYRRLRVPEYVHGYTEVVGKPELPVKGILLDLPAGKGALVSIESVESRGLSDYWIYPVPEKVVSGEGELATVSEVFAIDDAAYRVNSFYPDVAARAGETYDYRGQKKLQVFFNPFSFNPVTKDLIQYTRIRVRVAYVALAEALPAVKAGVPVTPAPSGLARAMVWVPPAPASAYKMLVSEEGIYRLTSAWLSSQGVSVSDWSQVRVYNLGQEIPVYQGADYIEFFGTPPIEAYSKYTRHNVYWLTTSGGSGSPLRMGTINGAPGTATIPTTHVFTVRTEEDSFYLFEAPGAESLDRWVFKAFAYGSGVALAGPVHYPITLPGVGGTQLGQVTVLLCGLTTLAHDVEIAFNGISLGTYQWSGFEFYGASFSDVPLVDGANTITLTCLSGADPVNPDGVALDWVEVAYPRKYEANGNVLKLTHNAGFRYQIGNFTSDSIQAYDITTPTDVKRITSVQVTGSNPYTLTMEPRSGAGERSYITLSSAAVKTPASITKDMAGNLSGSSNGADYILITHRDLGWDGGGAGQPWLANLKAHREAQGLRVKVVDVEDIYDEFSYGIVSPQGIKDFLSYAYQNWTSPAPQYVLLVGDSLDDPKDNYGLGSMNYVPTYLAQTPFRGESLTDEWYVRISGNDAIADMDIGRLPASTTAQAEMMVNKIMSYENTPVLKTWERNTLLVADNQVEGYEVLFELINEDVAGILPTGMNAPFREYLNDYVSPNDLTQSMRNRLNVDGALIWNYSGHGSVQEWATESIFSTGHVAGLNNSGKLPFVVAMTCLNGYFGSPEKSQPPLWPYPSLAEVLLRESANGAVAAFMSTGMTEPEGQRVLDQALFEGIFRRDKRTLGSAISYAKQELVANSVSLGETGKTFLLFGDPAMRLKVPLPTAPTAPTGQVTGRSVTLTWGASTDANGAPVAGYNVYRSTSPNGPYTKVNSSLITNTQYADSTVQSGTYYYIIKSVDEDGDESPGTLEMTVTVGARSVGASGGSGGGGGCFVSSML